MPHLKKRNDMSTSELIQMKKSLPYLEIEDVMPLFDYDNREALIRAIRAKRFPIPAYKIGKRYVIDREGIKAYFRRKRNEALEYVNR